MACYQKQLLQLHEDDSMMGQFKVGTSYTFVNNNTVATNNILLTPNPASKSININVEGTITENAVFQAQYEKLIFNAPASA
jgi:hypothetical protein